MVLSPLRRILCLVSTFFLQFWGYKPLVRRRKVIFDATNPTLFDLLPRCCCRTSPACPPNLLDGRGPDPGSATKRERQRPPRQDSRPTLQTLSVSALFLSRWACLSSNCCTNLCPPKTHGKPVAPLRGRSEGGLLRGAIIRTPQMPSKPMISTAGKFTSWRDPGVRAVCGIDAEPKRNERTQRTPPVLHEELF